MKKQQICILGSTGSIGTQALEVIEEHSERFEAYCLTANNKVELLAEQARKFRPAAVVIANEDKYEQLKTLLDRLAGMGYHLEFDDTVWEYLSEVGFDPAFGARPLRRAIQDHLEDPLASLILGGKIVPGRLITLGFSNGELTYK